MNHPQMAFIKAAASLRSMLNEMQRKNLDLKRLTKTATLMMLSGVSSNSIPPQLRERCYAEQNEDGGWVSIVDTLWNTAFLSLASPEDDGDRIQAGKNYLLMNKAKDGLWGRSQRDKSRIPISGVLLFLFPELGDSPTIQALENLWEEEKNSLTYKAAYTLVAFAACDYMPERSSLVSDTLKWLAANQKEDGSFSPWKDHPVRSDIYCTAVAAIGLTAYPHNVPKTVLTKTREWIVASQLPQGIWPYHEIEDGASWALLALARLARVE